MFYYCTCLVAQQGSPLRLTAVIPISIVHFLFAHDNDQATRRPVSVARVAASTVLLAKKKKGRGGGNNEGAQPRERKEKDDVIEVWRKMVGGTVELGQSSAHPRPKTLPFVFLVDLHRWRSNYCRCMHVRFALSRTSRLSGTAAPAQFASCPMQLRLSSRCNICIRTDDRHSCGVEVLRRSANDQQLVSIVLL